MILSVRVWGRGGPPSQSRAASKKHREWIICLTLKTNLWSTKTLHQYDFMIPHVKLPRVPGRHYWIPILQMRKQSSERSRVWCKITGPGGPRQGWIPVCQLLKSSSFYSIPPLRQIGRDQRSKKTKIFTVQRQKMVLLFLSWKIRYIWGNN